MPKDQYPDSPLRRPQGDGSIPPSAGSDIISGGQRQVPSSLASPETANPPASELVQMGGQVSRLPDVAFQPEAAIIVDRVLKMQAVSTDFSTGTDWVTLIEYKVGKNRKLVVADAWVRFSNPATGLIATAQVVSNDRVIVPRVEVSMADMNLRLVARGIQTVKLQIKRDASADGWSYGHYEAALRGWDVSDGLDSTQEAYK